MKAIQYRSYGDYSENRLVDLPRPDLKEGEVLIEMRAVGVNPLDNTFGPAISSSRSLRICHAWAASPERASSRKAGAHP